MIYSANYGAWDPPRQQAVPVQTYTEGDHPLAISADYPLPERTRFRLEAKFWKLHPEIACPKADVTIWMDASMTLLRDDFEALALAELGDDDALFMRHPWRDDIYDEGMASLELVPEKYAFQKIDAQMAHYRSEGHPEHWGLVHSGLIVRRDNERVRAFDAAWWAENLRWSVQDQLSLPPLLRTMDLRWHYWPIDPITAGWVRWGTYNA